MTIIWLTVILDPIAALAAIWSLILDDHNHHTWARITVLMRRSRLWCLWFRLALSVAAAGLAMQTIRSVASAVFHVDIPDKIMPYWALKDIGLCMAILGGLVALLTRKRR